MMNSDNGGSGLEKKAIEARMRTLRRTALERLRDGTTSIEQVALVTAPD